MTQNVKKAPEAQNIKKEPEGEKVKKYTINFGFSGIMTGLTVLVGCIVISFMMGVIVGRDEEPRAGMEKMLPHEQNNTGSAANAEDAEGKANTADKNASKDKVMTPEELKYASALKNKGANANTATKVGEKASAPKPATEKEGARKDNAQNKENAQAEPGPDTLFDFVFQVSSLKDEEAVDRLREKLEGEGLRTRSSKSGAYYIVFVLLRGTAQQAEGVRARMIALKLGDPLLKQKTAVQ